MPNEPPISPTRSILVPPHCPECGFEQTGITAPNASRSVRSLGPRFREALEPRPGTDRGLLRRRPDAHTWSALEYAAHVRDLIALWGSTLHLVLTQEHPAVPRPAADLPDRTAAEQAYNEQDPSAVTEQLSANAERMARKIDGMAAESWDRGVTVGDAEMTALDIVQKVVHEGRHHLHDVERVLGRQT